MAPKKTAMTQRPSGLRRLSPGVYRGADGALADSSGRPLNQRFRPPTQSVGGGSPDARYLPGPGRNVPNGLLEGVAAGIGGSLGRGGARPTEQDYMPATPDRRGPPNVFIQPYPGPQDSMRYPPGSVGPPLIDDRYSDRPLSLEEEARSRADAIAGGGMVTMDYNPQREALVEQYLDQMRRGGQMQSQPVGGGYNNVLQQQQAGFAEGFGGALARTKPYPLPMPNMEGGFAKPMPRPQTPMSGGMAQGALQGAVQGISAGLGNYQPRVRPPAPLPQNMPMGPIPRPRGR